MTGHPIPSEPLGRTTPDERRMERAPQDNANARPETGAPTYCLRGRFASRRTFTVPANIADQAAARFAPAPRWPRWYSSAAFTLTSMATLFAMCAIGRPGA